eukprot:4525170-Pyramimonas_sp.AAC.1
MDCLRMGAQRAELLIALEGKMKEEQEEWKKWSREEQTPNAEWGGLHSGAQGYSWTLFRDQNILELLQQRRRLRLELAGNISHEA